MIQNLITTLDAVATPHVHVPVLVVLDRTRSSTTRRTITTTLVVGVVVVVVVVVVVERGAMIAGSHS